MTEKVEPSLKTFPDEGDRSHGDRIYPEKLYHDWKKDFEASQQKKLEQAEYDLKHVGELNFVSYSRGHLIGYIRAKKEILG